MFVAGFSDLLVAMRCRPVWAGNWAEARNEAKRICGVQVQAGRCHATKPAEKFQVQGAQQQQQLVYVRIVADVAGPLLDHLKLFAVDGFKRMCFMVAPRSE